MIRRLWSVVAAGLLLLVLVIFWRDVPEAVALEGPVAMAGDSVRFVARWNVPSGILDSIAVRWSLTGNSNQRRTFAAPYPATITDTARFAALGVPGGGTAGGDISVTTWRGGAFSAVIKGYNVTLPDTGPPPVVTGLVLLDSAVVTNP